MSDIIAFSHKYNLYLIKKEDIQNMSLFIISCLTFLSYLYYNFAPLWYENNKKMDFIKPFDILFPFVGLHALIDFFLTNSYDLKLHHFFIFGIIFYNYY